MKQLIVALALAGIMISCNSSDKTKNNKETPIEETPTDSTAQQSNSPFVAINTNQALIATALMAAPEASRDGCKVIGYNMDGEFVTLKEGDNEFIVLADDPRKEGFNAACYHKDLEPFMARGRDLREQGLNAAQIFDIREEEVASGKLSMGEPGLTLHIYYGPNQLYDPETSKVADAQYRYVVYVPYATAKSTGLPEKPIAPNHPWLMDPGTHRAHIMISPLPNNTNQ
ncbi:hypothetical protein [Xanthomarina gelatinilytica]|uniref:hypothetical protein n=1 Tax=Xanthomarina gelatinilytica TaxID=1137281 RepID=UPI0035132D50